MLQHILHLIIDGDLIGTCYTWFEGDDEWASRNIVDDYYNRNRSGVDESGEFGVWNGQKS